MRDTEELCALGAPPLDRLMFSSLAYPIVIHLSILLAQHRRVTRVRRRAHAAPTRSSKELVSLPCAPLLPMRQPAPLPASRCTLSPGAHPPSLDGHFFVGRGCLEEKCVEKCVPRTSALCAHKLAYKFYVCSNNAFKSTDTHDHTYTGSVFSIFFFFVFFTIDRLSNMVDEREEKWLSVRNVLPIDARISRF
jgi:hypothetical protein